MTISYDAYRVFDVVARSGSFTRAAQELNTGQPNVTRTVGNLERALGCTLFARTKHGATLTPEGEKLYAHIAAAVRHIQAGEAEIAAANSLEDGIVSIAASENALRGCLLPVLESVREKYPKLRLRVANCSSAQGVDALNDGTADMAVVTTPFDLPANIDSVPVKTFRETAVAGRAFAYLADAPLTFADLARFPLVCPNEKTATRRFYAGLFAQNGAPFRPAVEAATSDQILPLVKSNLGIGFVSRDFLTDADGVVPLRIDIPAREIRLLKRRDKPLSLAARTVFQAFLNAAESPSGTSA